MSLYKASFIFYVLLSFSTVTASGQTCGEPKSSKMDCALIGHVCSTMKVQEYPACIKSCMEDDNCVNCNYDLVSQQCEFSNVTKAMFPDEFVNKYYSIYRPTDVLIDLCLTSVLSILTDHYTSYVLRNRLKQTSF